MSLDALGRLALERGDTAAATAAFEHAVAIWRQPDGRHLLDRGLADLSLALQAAGDVRAARRVLEEARRVRATRLGASHPAVGDLDRMLGELLLGAGDAAAARPWLEQAGRLTLVGYGAGDPRTLQAQLALVRLQSAQDGNGDAPLQRFAATLPADGSLAALRWEARAYAAMARCQAGATAGERQLQALDTELRSARPEGGRLSREVAGLAGSCRARLNGMAASAVAH
jgi:serine/threonine-protein kinase